MRCFVHPDRDSVGICKHCQRGLCMECAALVQGVLACRELHENEVADLLRMLATDIVQSGRVRSGYIRNAVFYGLVGVIFALLGASQIRFLGPQAVFFIIVGCLLLYAAAANFLEARRFH